MPHQSGWRALYCSDDLNEARAVATSVASMEFDVRLRDGSLRVAPRTTALDTYVVDVRGGDWIDLADVLDEIVGEQREFDELLRSRDVQEGRVVRVCLVALTATIAVLAITGAIEL